MSNASIAQAKTIVTRNFKKETDEEDGYQSRKDFESGVSYVPRPAIGLRDVKFLQTGYGSDFQYESGFACGIVAQGIEAQTIEIDPTKLIRIEFRGSGFYTVPHKGKGEYVEEAQVVIFNEHGMFAVLN